MAVAELPNRFPNQEGGVHWNEKRPADYFHASSSLACISAGGFIRTGHVEKQGAAVTEAVKV